MRLQHKIYIGNLAWKADEADLKTFFSRFGTVVDARIVIDRETGRSRGFGFVSFAEEGAMQQALTADGAELSGRALKVSLAIERPKRGRMVGRYGRRLRH